MYIGEVNIHQDQLNFLLVAAEALKIKGLVTSQQEMLNQIRENETSSSAEEPPKKKSKVDVTPNVNSNTFLHSSSMSTPLTAEENLLQPIVKLEQNDENTPLQIDTSPKQISSNSNDGQVRTQTYVLFLKLHVLFASYFISMPDVICTLCFY